MPIYQYHCTSCGRDLEIFQHMTDPTLTVCPECAGHLRKVFSPVGIVFKGSGFYATDNKKSTSVSTPAATTSTTSDTAVAKSTDTAATPSTPSSSDPATTAKSTSTPASTTATGSTAAAS